MFKPRTLSAVLQRAVRTFPAAVVSGPRQSGKTTLLKKIFGRTHAFVSLEDLNVRELAQKDPLAFLQQWAPPVIIDEIQYAPDLLPYLKTRIDEHRRPGRYLLTGSQNFALMRGVSQSLAGRAAVVSLLPFSVGEILGKGDRLAAPDRWLKRPRSSPSRPGIALETLLLRGGYPEIASRLSVDRDLWCGSYLTTYLERDVRQLASIGDLSQFQTFLRQCAARTAQLLNLTDMARDVGISVPTARRWLSLLEASYQVLLLYPYYRNIGKRLIKTPKMYFTDTGLASYLLGIHRRDALRQGPSFGALFETFVIVDVWKRYLHYGRQAPLYFLRTPDDLEIDLVIEEAERLHLLEIKSAVTVTSKHAQSLNRTVQQLGNRVASARLLSLAPSPLPLGDRVSAVPAIDFLTR